MSNRKICFSSITGFSLIFLVLFFIVTGSACSERNKQLSFSADSLKLWLETGLMFDSHLRPKSIVETDPDNVWVCVSSLTGSPDPNLPVTVYYSHNGGRNWGYYNFEGSESCGSGFIASCDGNTAWIFIDDQGLMKTSDGGKTWVNINHSLLRFENTGLYFFDEKTGIAIFNVDNPGWVNDTLALFRSVDGGYNWKEIP